MSDTQNTPPKTSSNNSILYAVIAVLALAVAVLGYMVFSQKQAELQAAAQAEEDRIVFERPEELTPERLDRIVMRNCQLTPFKVDGDSMQPAFRDGGTYVFHTGEKCPFLAMIDRDGVALLDTGRVDKMVMKFVKGLPGDTFALDRRPGRVSVLTVNGKDVKNSAGRPYQIERTRQKLLEMYVRDYNGTIPANAYLLLGDNIRGSLDSTQFGLVHVNDIRGVMRSEDQEAAMKPRRPAVQLRPQPQPQPAPQAEPAPAPEPTVDTPVEVEEIETEMEEVPSPEEAVQDITPEAVDEELTAEESPDGSL